MLAANDNETGNKCRDLQEGSFHTSDGFESMHRYKKI
jgi:hypothetical protein